jgi:RNA polymerase sigma factor for flagellar operon FliA
MGQASSPTMNALIVAHLFVVRHIAVRLKRRLPAQIQLSELIAVGYLALRLLAPRFHTRHGVPFEAYIRPRIHGAMVDYLRAESPLSRRELRELRAQRLETESPLIAPVRLVPLDEARGDVPDPDPGPEVRARQAERRVILRRAIRTLGRRDRKILIGYYFEDRTLADIGTDHHIGESRVSQLRTAALHTLRRAMTGAAH